MKRALPDVTLCAVTSINHELTAWAMKKCLEQCEFGDVVMISDQPVSLQSGIPFRVEIVPTFSGAEYAPFVCRNLAHHTTTSHNLLVQYDSFVTDGAAWDDRFLDYDYIGPKWPWHMENRRVGNSGFCLRSKKLLDILADMPLPPTGEFVDDTFICHTKRTWFEKTHDIRIAPEDIADLFAYERHVPDQPTFGFHGMFNYWRYVGDNEMIWLIDRLHDLYIYSRPYAEIVFHYYNTRQFPVFFHAYARLRDHITQDKVREHLAQFLKDENFIDALAKCGGQRMT